MNSVFKYSNYVAYLNDLVKERRQRGKTNADLAKVLGCQAAYLSQVLSGRVELTEDHLLQLSEFLELSERESEYLLVLLRQAKAGTPQLRGYLAKRADRLRVEQSEDEDEFERRLSAKKVKSVDEGSIYYASSFVPSLIHLATSCPDLQTVESIASRFGLSSEIVSHHLDQLEKYKLVEFKKNRWHFTGTSLHFPKNSPIDQQMQVSRRLLAMVRLPQRREQDLHYSVIFAATDATLVRLRSQLQDTIEMIHKTVEPASSENVYAICIDAFQA